MALVVVTSGCDPLSNGKVKNAFLDKHPKFQVTEVNADGNQSGAYWYVKYKKPDDNRVFYVICKFNDQGLVESKEDVWISTGPSAGGGKR